MICAYSGCGKEFEPNSPNRNQKYCSYECSVRANNKRAMERYNEAKELMRDPMRVCQSPGCGTVLRRTNTRSYCDPCQRKIKDSRKKSFIDMVTDASNPRVGK